MPDKSVELRLILSGIFLMSDFFDKCSVFLWRFSGLCQMVLMTSKTSLQKWSGVFLFPSVSPVFFQIGTVTYQHRLRFRWRGFMYEFLPLIRKARTRCDLCRALHDFARLRLTSQCLPAGNYGWRKCIQRGCLKNTSSVSF